MPNDVLVPEIQMNLEEAISKTKLNGQIVQRLMSEVLKKDEHYGVIPGTQKPTLLKSGAEKLAFTFRLDPQYKTEINDLGNGHREVIVTCTIYSSETERRLGSGSGSCSTLETKYRYRGNSFEVTDEEIPLDYKEKKDFYKKQGFGAKQIDNQWRWVRFLGERAENPDIADQYNTVLKMAQKRAFIAATLTVLAVSDMFTQDVEDFLQTPAGTVNRTTGELVDEKNKKPTSKPTTTNQNKPNGSQPNNDPPKPEHQTPDEKLEKLDGELDSLEESNATREQKIDRLTKLMERWDKLADELTDTVYGKGMQRMQTLFAKYQDEKGGLF
ncbi:hypothetical protein [Leptospira jelokensis]|uniref:Uncharacterized protein n=1 Tax=Leptospira jelokensis TaxID=2484931 RepID=A0A4Z1A245_9LEPT|nr:hypothetical protein [Leptospira jelokensis]TGL58589.1 hypothetical protein EHQ62_16980 [Leptospira jelokensis]